MWEFIYIYMPDEEIKRTDTQTLCKHGERGNVQYLYIVDMYY